MSTSGPTLANRYDRADLGPGVLGWVYEYVNTERITRSDGMATGLELGVQLTGDWFHDGARTGARLCGPGSLHVISPAERYSLSMSARGHEAGVQVGFIVYPDVVDGLGTCDGDVVFADGPRLDRTFFEFCQAYRAANDRGFPLPETQVRAEVLRFVKDRVAIVRRDRLAMAKKTIEETFTRPLYLEHLAAVAGMHPRTFARHFAARYGHTPIAYRLRLRLNESARLTWAEPTLALRAVAERVGFEDMPYFHRAFVAEFGVTPAHYGRRARSADARRLTGAA